MNGIDLIVVATMVPRDRKFLWGRAARRRGGFGLNREGTFGADCRNGARSRLRTSPLTLPSGPA